MDSKPNQLRKMYRNIEIEYNSLITTAKSKAMSGVKADAKSLLIIMGVLNTITVIVFKVPGFLVCLAADAVILIGAPSLDFLARFLHESRNIFSDKETLNTKMDMIKEQIDDYYKEKNLNETLIKSNNIQYESKKTDIKEFNLIDNLNSVKQSISKPLEKLLKFNNNRK